MLDMQIAYETTAICEIGLTKRTECSVSVNQLDNGSRKYVYTDAEGSVF